MLSSRAPGGCATEADEWRITRDELFTGPSCRSQVHLSLTLAKLHPDLTMPIFSGLCFSLSVFITDVSEAEVKARYCEAEARDVP